MLARAALALLLATPVVAHAEGKPLTGKGYFTGCDAEGDPIYCYIGAVGFSYAVAEAIVIGVIIATISAVQITLSGRKKNDL